MGLTNGSECRLPVSTLPHLASLVTHHLGVVYGPPTISLNISLPLFCSTTSMTLRFSPSSSISTIPLSSYSWFFSWLIVFSLVDRPLSRSSSTWVDAPERCSSDDGGFPIDLELEESALLGDIVLSLARWCWLYESERELCLLRNPGVRQECKGRVCKEKRERWGMTYFGESHLGLRSIFPFPVGDDRCGQATAWTTTIPTGC